MKIINMKIENVLFIFYSIVIVAILVSVEKNYEVVEAYMPVAQKVVLIDAGHGGEDPGAMTGNIEEKELNLKIALKLKAYLEQGGSYVLMTREEDEALAKNKKSDMYRRKEIANSSEADIFVSIHQNYNRRASAQGAQVYYFEKSEKSKKLGLSIQEQIKKFANPSNKMTSMANTEYYVLRQTVMPAVLVECGFMSNSGERWKLTTDDYQERIAWAIYLGIVNYFQDEWEDKNLRNNFERIFKVVTNSEL